MKFTKGHTVIIASVSIVLIIGIIVTFYACRPEAQSRRTLAVSIQPQRFLLEQIAGKYYDVVSLLQDGANPEQYEPSMNNVMALEQCDAYFMVGHIGFEAAILNRVTVSRPDLKVCDTSAGINLINTPHGTTAGDPHVWASVRNARIMAQNMLAALVELDSKHESYYRRQCLALLKHLDELDNDITMRLDSCGNKAFVVWHPALSYFARDYGLTQIAIEDDSGKVTQQRLRQVIDQAREQRAKVFFYQKEFDKRAVEAANQEIGSQLVEFSPMAYDWYDEMLKISQAIRNNSR